MICTKDSDDDFDHEKLAQWRGRQGARAKQSTIAEMQSKVPLPKCSRVRQEPKKRMKQGRSESEDARLALCRVQKKISRGERLDCANRIRAAVATEAALAQNDELPPQFETHAEPDGAQPEDGDWNDELQEGESAAGRMTRLEDAGQLHRLSRWEKHELMADMFPE